MSSAAPPFSAAAADAAPAPAPASPGPPPTTSAAPDVRAQKLQALFDAALDATLAKVSYENFAACFPTAAQHRPDTLRRFWADFVARLGERCRVSRECVSAPRPLSLSLFLSLPLSFPVSLHLSLRRCPAVLAS